MSKVLLSDSFTPPPEFVYDAARPTYYSELYAYSLHKYQAALAAAGAADEIETNDSGQSLAVISQYAGDLTTWISSAFDMFSEYQKSDSTELPVLPELPGVPDLLEKAIMLFPGGKLALILKVAVPAIRGFLQLRNSVRETDPARILAKALLKENWYTLGLTSKPYLEIINDSIQEQKGLTQDMFDLLKSNFEGEFTVTETQETYQLNIINAFFRIWRSLQTFDCNTNALSLADVLKVALTRCVEAGGDSFDLQSIQDSLDALSASLAGVSVEIETEKAARVKLSGIDAQEQIQFPS